MDIAVTTLIVDSATALSAIAGVVVATLLGRKAVRVARETVDRAERDYAASRVDSVWDWHSKVVAEMADIRADLHIFWNGELQKKLTSDPGSKEAQEIRARQHAAEVEVHRGVYRLKGSCDGLDSLVAGLRMNYNAAKLPDQSNILRARAAILLYSSSAMPHYLSLVPAKKRFPNPLLESEKFARFYLDQLNICASNEEEKAIEEKARLWLLDYIKTRHVGQVSPEIISENFITSFAWAELHDALAELVEPILEICSPTVNDKRVAV